MVDSTTLDNVGTEQSITPPPPIQPPLRDHTGPSFDFDALLGNLNHQAIAGGMPAQAPPRPDLTGSLEVMAVSQDDQGMQTVEVRLNLENIGDASADAPLKVQFYALSTQNSFLEPVELASLQSFDLAPRGAHVENLTIDSAAGPINAYGNALNNSLTGQIDTLSGGTGKDLFVVGSAALNFYADGDSSYAKITDFNPAEDVVQLFGSAAHYVLSTAPTSFGSGMALYFKATDSATPDLVAIFENASGLSLSGDYFSFSAKPGSVAFAASSYTVDENGAASLDVTLTRSGGADGEISVLISSSDGTATSPNDYTAISQTVTFLNGETTKTVQIQIANDALVEPSELFSLALGSPTGGAAIGTINGAAVSILSDDANPNPDPDPNPDPTPGVISFGASQYQFNENGQPLTQITLLRSGDTDGAVTGQLTLSSGTASTDDYVALSETISFPSAEKIKTIPISITNDLFREADVSFSISLSNPSDGVVLGSIASSTVTTIDNDTPQSPPLLNWSC